MDEVTYTWADRELPVLRAALRHIDVDGDMFPELVV
jgi:hypothetical protein